MAKSNTDGFKKIALELNYSNLIILIFAILDVYVHARKFDSLSVFFGPSRAQNGNWIAYPDCRVFLRQNPDRGKFVPVTWVLNTPSQEPKDLWT